MSALFGESVRESLNWGKAPTIPLSAPFGSVACAKLARIDSDRLRHLPCCFEGTRETVLAPIFRWIRDIHPSTSHIFLLNGVALIGKTAIATTLVQRAKDNGHIAAHFFFSRAGDSELRNPALVFPHIAYQLASLDAELNQLIAAALATNSAGPTSSLQQQFSELILEPFSGLQEPPTKAVVIILDALDECESSGSKEILEIFVGGASQLPNFLKIIVTGRPGLYLHSALAASDHVVRSVALHDIEASIVSNDMHIYLDACLRRLPQELLLDYREEWVEAIELEQLVEKAGSLFVTTDALLRFISDATVSDPRHQLEILLTRPVDHIAFAEVDATFKGLLRRAFPPPRTSDTLEQFQLVVGATISLHTPLHQVAIEKMLNLSHEKVAGIVRSLEGLISPGDAPHFIPRVYHSSFTCFITDRTRCTDPVMFINTKQQEARMAFRCLQLLTEETGPLHENMLGDIYPSLWNSGIDNLGEKVGAVLSLEVQYACRFWVAHLMSASANGVTSSLKELLEIFAHRKLLPWLEAMSWLAKPDEAFQCLTRITEWIVSILFVSIYLS